MVNLSSALAHAVKMVISLACLKCIFIEDYALEHRWTVRALQLLLLHSILGIITFGSRINTPSNLLRKTSSYLYTWCSKFVDSIFLIFFTVDILNTYKINSNFLLMLSLVGILPIIAKLTAKPTEIQLWNDVYSVNITTPLLLIVILIVGLGNGNLAVISFTSSIVIECFLVDEISCFFDIPFIDLKQYCLSFVEIIAILTIRNK